MIIIWSGEAKCIFHSYFQEAVLSYLCTPYQFYVSFKRTLGISFYQTSLLCGGHVSFIIV